MGGILRCPLYWRQTERKPPLEAPFGGKHSESALTKQPGITPSRSAHIRSELVTPSVSLVTIFFLRFYLFIYERHTEKERQRHRQRQKQAPCRESNVGLGPGTPGSHPEPKADAQPLSHLGGPSINFLASDKLRQTEASPLSRCDSGFTDFELNDHLPHQPQMSFTVNTGFIPSLHCGDIEQTPHRHGTPLSRAPG